MGFSVADSPLVDVEVSFNVRAHEIQCGIRSNDGSDPAAALDVELGVAIEVPNCMLVRDRLQWVRIGIGRERWREGHVWNTEDTADCTHYKQLVSSAQRKEEGPCLGNQAGAAHTVVNDLDDVEIILERFYIHAVGLSCSVHDGRL